MKPNLSRCLRVERTSSLVHDHIKDNAFNNGKTMKELLTFQVIRFLDKYPDWMKQEYTPSELEMKHDMKVMSFPANYNRQLHNLCNNAGISVKAFVVLAALIEKENHL